jgi:hypothetical protein
MYERDEKCILNLQYENLKGRDHLEGTGLDRE